MYQTRVEDGNTVGLNVVIVSTRDLSGVDIDDNHFPFVDTGN